MSVAVEPDARTGVRAQLEDISKRFGATQAFPPPQQGQYGGGQYPGAGQQPGWPGAPAGPPTATLQGGPPPAGWGGGPSRRSAMVLRFCTMAARWNSSRAPERPRSRMRSKA